MNFWIVGEQRGANADKLARRGRGDGAAGGVFVRCTKGLFPLRPIDPDAYFVAFVAPVFAIVVFCSTSFVESYIVAVIVERIRTEGVPRPRL